MGFADLHIHTVYSYDGTVLGNRDAHIVEAIGLSMTEFPGNTAQDLIEAIHKGEKVIHNTAGLEHGPHPGKLGGKLYRQYFLTPW